MANWWEKLQRLMTGHPAADDAAEGKPRQGPKDPLGMRGENVAAKHLQKLGYRIYGRNFKTPMGEIDIIARDGKTLVFCEVKTRAYDEPTPEEQVDSSKMHQVTKAARFYLSRYGQSPPPARFDVVAIVWPQGQEPIIRHIPNAFEPTF
jgi:putative endonuclease